jgi:outer membrane protein OmpA-like peptidoglycan-associated protein
MAQPPDDYGELRHLLLAPEQQELDELRRLVREPKQPDAELVAEVLPAAFTRASEGDKELSAAMLPLVEGSIAQSVRQRPEVIAEAIFPIIGTAISRAMREAFSRMMQQTTYALENAFSLRSWRWRLEARATGKTFSEVVLLHSLVYRVEQVFLIHPESGLLLQHVYADSLAAGGGVGDASLVSSMLTAIQAFVRDSFRVESKAVLDTIEVGDLTVWIERGPQAVLAGVIRGTAPLALRAVLRTELEACHRDCKAALRSFGGNPDEMVAARPHLERCLKSQLQTERKRPVLAWVIIAAALLALGSLAGHRLWLEHVRTQRFEASVDRLRQEAGVVVLSAERRGGRQRIFALRDPDAHTEAELLQRAQISSQQTAVSWRSFVASDEEIVRMRAQKLLRPPPEVRLELSDGTLTATGSAQEEWIANAQLLAQAIPGVRVFRCEVKPLPRPPDLYEVLSARARVIEAIEVHFRAGSVELLPGQDVEIQRAIKEMRELLRLAEAERTGLQIMIEIHAYTDDIGNELYNLRLRESRAKVMWHWLAAGGVDERHLKAVAPLDFERERSARAAGFRIAITAGARGPKRAR